MKILITGYTTRMFGSTQIKGDYVTFSFLLEEILRDMGHEVHRRLPKIDEEINHVYDYAFCGIAPLSSMTSGRVPETHYVLDTMEGRCCLYADDWSVCGFGGSVRYTLPQWKKFVDYKGWNHSEYHLKETRRSLNLLADMEYYQNPPLLAPMFPWGDHEFLLRNNINSRLWTVDPSAWLKYPTIKTYKPENKNRAWVMAALSDHSPWVNRQKFGLPVEYIGNKKYSRGRSYSESMTVQYFAQNYGVLACKYPSAGSGWWRTRYLNAAWAETLVYADPIDQQYLGEAYRGSVSNFESLDSQQYNFRVTYQNDWLQFHISSKDTVKETLERLIKK